MFDSVQLAKLALLDKAGLQQLAQLAGVTTDPFGSTDNVVAYAFASLDGNHQWMEEAPLRPSVMGAVARSVDLPVPPEVVPGYDFKKGYATKNGFVPWKEGVREALFRKLFKGPLSPGVETPYEIGLAPVLPDTYPYRPCAAVPFPDSANFRCNDAQLTPWAAPTPPRQVPPEPLPGCSPRPGRPTCMVP
ncbi:MAG: hypothetical protein QM788_08310 [Roseateles sp.]|uniref:hypothetical protein n=1 Tax=Roseateles sp. TaxID=1971397 RepID=UPI0039EA7351